MYLWGFVCVCVCVNILVVEMHFKDACMVTVVISGIGHNRKEGGRALGQQLT